MSKVMHRITSVCLSCGWGLVIIIESAFFLALPCVPLSYCAVEILDALWNTHMGIWVWLDYSWWLEEGQSLALSLIWELKDLPLISFLLIMEISFSPLSDQCWLRLIASWAQISSCARQLDPLISYNEFFYPAPPENFPLKEKLLIRGVFWTSFLSFSSLHFWIFRCLWLLYVLSCPE